MRLEELGKLKKIHLIGTRTRDLPACSSASVNYATACPYRPQNKPLHKPTLKTFYYSLHVSSLNDHLVTNKFVSFKLNYLKNVQMYKNVDRIMKLC
jgi:hypothetical protein